MTFQPKPTEGRRRKSGFTLVEIMIVVTIIGLLAVLALPVWTKARQNSLTSAFINDLRLGVEAAQRCSMEQGSWPAETAAGVEPAAMVSYLRTDYWTKPTPIGGQWDWEFAKSGVAAGLAVVNPTDVSIMQQVDLRYDDGNLSTGRFRNLNGGYVYILE